MEHLSQGLIEYTGQLSFFFPCVTAIQGNDHCGLYHVVGRDQC